MIAVVGGERWGCWIATWNLARAPLVWLIESIQGRRHPRSSDMQTLRSACALDPDTARMNGRSVAEAVEKWD
jgi:hypothetical protein